MPLSGNARKAEPAISGVSLQQAPDQTDVSAAGRTKYDGYIWRLDAKDRDQLPRRFRTANSAFRSHVDVKKTGKGFTMTPSRKGLDRLNISGSAEFSVGEFEKLVSVLKKQANGPIYIVDLRQETHGIFNGNAVSWFGARDWGNIGKNKTDVLKDEMKRLCAAKGKSLIVSWWNKMVCIITALRQRIISGHRLKTLMTSSPSYAHCPIMHGCTSTAGRAKDVLRFIWPCMI